MEFCNKMHEEASYELIQSNKMRSVCGGMQSKNKLEKRPPSVGVFQAIVEFYAAILYYRISKCLTIMPRIGATIKIDVFNSMHVIVLFLVTGQRSCAEWERFLVGPKWW